MAFEKWYDTSMKSIYKSAGVILENRKLLVTRAQGKNIFVAPGGKREGQETDTQTLARELHEELSISIDESTLENFGTWSAEAAGQEGTVVEMHVFIVKTYYGTITPSNEIEEVKWVNTSDLASIELGSIFKHDVIPKLVELDLID